MNSFVHKASAKISKLSDQQVESLLEELNEENALLKSILGSLSTGLIITDVNWNILEFNKAAERYFSSSLEFSKNILDVVTDKEINNFIADTIKKNFSNVSKEFSVEMSDGKVHFIAVKILPFLLKGEISGNIITADDVTEKRLQDVLVHRMEGLQSLTNLAASVAHETKNPLGAISIHIQLLQRSIKKARNGDGSLPDKKFLENYLDVVNEEIDSLNKIVVDFLFAVRPVQAKLEFKNPMEIVCKIGQFFEPEFHSKNVNLKINNTSSDLKLLIDEKLFKECVINIIQNGFAAVCQRFENSQGGEIQIESKTKDDFFYLTIADNGTGMDEQTAARIFEPYFTTKANGTGLGLTTVYKIIKEFNGDINVKSVLGKGTIFTIQLPVPQSSTKLLS